MNEVMRMSRKALILAVTVTTLAWGVMATAMFAPLTASAAGCTGGTLIKGSLSAVYYCGGDGKRYVFPNEKTYKTWYSDFSTVTTISDADLATVQIGGNVTYRPGVKMVKITTDPKVYAVSMNGVLRPIADEATAESLYGSAWNTMIDDVPDAFFTNYTVGASAAGYDKAAEMSGSQTINEDKGLAGGAVGGAVTVSLAADNPAGSTVPGSATGVNMLKFVLTNGGATTATVNSLVLHRTGPGTSTDLSYVYLYEGSERLTTGRSVNSTTNDATFSGLSLELAPGASRTLWASVTLASSPGAGNVHALQVTGGKVGTADIGGVPLTGNNFTMSSATVGSLTIAKTGSITNPKVGQQDVKVAEFTIAAGSSENVRVNRLTLFQAGNLSSANLTNLELKQAGNLIASASGFDANLRTTFDITGGMLLEKGQTRTFQIFADIGGTSRVSDSIKLYVDEDSDLYGVGETYGYGASVTRTTYDGDSCTSASGDCSYSTLDGGQVTINFNGPSSTDIAANAKDVALYKFSITSQANVEVRNLRTNIAASASASGASGLLTTSNVAQVTDIKVTNDDTGIVWWGPSDVSGTDGTAADNDLEQDIVYTDVQTLTAGEVYNFTVTADLASTVTAGETLTFRLDAFGSSDIRNLDNSTFVATTDIVPSTALTGNAMTMRSPSLTNSLGSAPISQTVVKGSSSVAFLGANLTAGDAADITVTQIVFTGYIDEDATGGYTAGVDNSVNVSDVVTSCVLMDGTTQLGSTESPAATTGLLTFNGFNLEVTAGTTKNLQLACNINNAAYYNSDSDLVGFAIQSATNVTAQDPDGNSVTPTGTVNASAATVGVTVTNTGSMSYALAPDDTESEAGLVVAGTSEAVLAKIRMTALYEELKQTKLRVSLGTAASYTSVLSMSLYDGATKIAGPVALTYTGSATYADFSGFEFVVAKNSSKTLTVKAAIQTINGGASSGADLAVSIDLTSPTSGTFEYRGTNSSTVVTTISSTDLTGNTKIVRKTKPTISNASLSTTTLTNGDMVVSRITITADSAEQVAIKAIKWTINNSGTALAAKSNSSVREYGTGSYIAGNVDVHDGTESSACGNSDTTCYASTSFTTEQIVAAGTSKTFELVLAVSDVASNESVSAYIAGDTALVTGEVESDAATGSFVDGDLIDDLDGTNGTAAFNFVWSDNSGIPHTSTVDATTSSDDASYSNDWTNGLYVKVLPSDAVALVAP